MASSTGLRARWERLTERERRMVAAMAVVFAVVIVGVVTFLINDGLSTLSEENDAMRTALADIETGRSAYLRARQKTSQLEVRIGRGGVQLQGYLEQAAKDAGIAIDETTELKPAPAGKAYVERSVELRLRKVGLEPLARFLRKIETGPNLVVVTGLDVRTRDDRHEEFEVEMTVSTYEHAPPEKPGAKKENKG